MPLSATRPAQATQARWLAPGGRHGLDVRIRTVRARNDGEHQPQIRDVACQRANLRERLGGPAPGDDVAAAQYAPCRRLQCRDTTEVCRPPNATAGVTADIER